MVPEQGTAIIVLSNFSNANLSNGNPKGLLYQVADIVFADCIAEPIQSARRQVQGKRLQTPEPPALTKEQLREYEGTYYSEELDAFQTVVFKEKTLVLWIKKREGVPLSVRKIDLFSFGSNFINFLRDNKNRIIAYTITTPFVRNVKFDKEIE